MSKRTPTLPADAIGYIARHADRPERLALLRPDGRVSNWFAQDDTLDTLRAALAQHGMDVDAAGIVRRVAG